jgi:hypothetical protein
VTQWIWLMVLWSVKSFQREVFATPVCWGVFFFGGVLNFFLDPAVDAGNIFSGTEPNVWAMNNIHVRGARRLS